MRQRGELVCFLGACLAMNTLCPAACVSDADGDGVCDGVDQCPGTIMGATVDSSGCPALIPGDFNRDGDVDPDDLGLMAVCRSGAMAPSSAACLAGTFDFDLDTDVDQDDFGTFQRCFSGTDHPASPSCARHTATITNGCLIVTGTAASTQLALRLKAGAPVLLEVDVDNNGSADFTFARAFFSCIIVNAGNGDDAVLIDEANGVFTNTEITTLNGGNGNDTLFGGSGNETFSGGEGNDSIFAGAGNDDILWNSGDDTDVVEGAEGIDTVEINSGNGDEAFTITANGTRVRFDRINPAPFSLDIGTTENLVLNANGGNDTLSCTGNLATLIQITADGGAGDDTLLGSNGADVLIGGDNNDFIDGNQGSDVAFLGAGDDTFQWDPGDANDTVEGQAGNDKLVFNGANIGEIFDLSANGWRLRLTRNIGNVVMDLDDVERVDLRMLGGADLATVNNLGGTDVTQVNFDLASTLGGAAGDAQADQVVVNATNGNDTVTVAGGGTAATVSGLAAVVSVTTIEAANDRLTINALGGADTVQATGLAAGVVGLTLNGGVGDDILTGSNGVDLLNGDDDNDTLTGGDGDDTAQGGLGNDYIVWNSGDDTDVVEGGDGIDTVEINSGNGDEAFTITANGTRVRFDRINPAPFSLDIGTTENLVLYANGGNDTLTCTGNLATLIQITADGGAGDDTLLGSNGIDVLIGGDNNDFIDGNQGSDVAFLGAGDDTFQWDPGDGNDTIEGQTGNDRLAFNGSNIGEIFDLSANGGRLRLTRNIGNVVMDLDDVERVDLNMLGGADLATVNNLAGTDMTQVNFELAGTLGGAIGDAQPDAIVVNGTANPDTIGVSANAGSVFVTGLSASVSITRSEPANDTLTVNGLGGADTLTQGPGIAALIQLTLNQ